MPGAHGRGSLPRVATSDYQRSSDAFGVGICRSPANTRIRPTACNMGAHIAGFTGRLSNRTSSRVSSVLQPAPPRFLSHPLFPLLVTSVITVVRPILGCTLVLTAAVLHGFDSLRLLFVAEDYPRWSTSFLSGFRVLGADFSKKWQL